MIREKKILYNAEFGESADEIEIARPLTNKELEERLYELTDIVKELALALYPHFNEKMWDWMERLDKLQEDLS